MNQSRVMIRAIDVREKRKNLQRYFIHELLASIDSRDGFRSGLSGSQASRLSISSILQSTRLFTVRLICLSLVETKFQPNHRATRQNQSSVVCIPMIVASPKEFRPISVAIIGGHRNQLVWTICQTTRICLTLFLIQSHESKLASKIGMV